MVPEPAGLGSQISVFKPAFCAQSAVDIPTIPAPTTIRSKSFCEVVEFGKGAHLLDRVWGTGLIIYGFGLGCNSNIVLRHCYEFYFIYFACFVYTECVVISYGREIMAGSNVVKLPTSQEIEQAKETSRALSKYSNEQLRIRVFDKNDQGEDMVLPGYAFNLLLDILTQMSKGNAVSFMPVNAELSTQQAASLLNVSRPYFIELLNKGAIPFRKVGTHRRVLAKDVFAYKDHEDQERLKVLDELAGQAQELGMGYE